MIADDENKYEYIKSNIEKVKEKVAAAAKRSGRKSEDIKIIAVTKTIDTPRIEKAIDEGILDLGENRVQELLEKYDIINKSCRWHLIGHLQTNKVKYIIDKVELLHSLDSMELARELQKRAQKLGRVINSLVQVNIAGEETKFGLEPGKVMDFIRNVSTMPNIKIKGLMTIAPFAQNTEEIRFVFRDLRKMLIDIRTENIDNIDMDFLSMGMSNDFEVAIEEGSNIVRIGTAIFGERHYS